MNGKRLVYQPTVSLGTILTILSVLLTGVGTFFGVVMWVANITSTMEHRLTTVEHVAGGAQEEVNKVAGQVDILRDQTTTMVSEVAALKASMLQILEFQRDTVATLARIETRLYPPLGDGGPGRPR